MKYPRLDLLDKLRVIAPALATKALIEELVHVWFDGKVVQAYDDRIGIEVPFSTELKGGLQGALLIGFLEKSRAREVEITGDEQLLLKAANARLEMSMLPWERVVWEFPQFNAQFSLPINEALIWALKSVMVSIGGDTSNPNALGITIVSGDEGLDLYSTDSISLSWVHSKPLRDVHVERCVLPQPFCEQIIRLFSKSGGDLHVTPDFAVAENKEGVRLFSRLVEVERPADFTGSIDKHYLGSDLKLIPLPQRLKLAIERVMVVLEGRQGASAQMFIDKDFLRIHAESNGTGILLKDSMKLDAEHPEDLIRISPELVKRVLPQADRFSLSRECLVLAGPGGFVHIIGSKEG